MRDSYEPPMPPGGPAGPGGPGGPFEPRTQHLPRRLADPYDDFAARMGEAVGETRAAGLRRLSKLTWRSVQLSALATVGFVTLFVRSAPAQTVSSQSGTAPSPARTSTSPSPSPSSSPSKTKAKTKAATAAPKPRPVSAAPSAAPAPSPTLAPPAAPPPAPAPAPVQTTSSGSHGG